MTDIDDSPKLSPQEIKYIQQVVGQFYYYARAIDNTMQHALNEIAIATLHGTQQTKKAIDHFLNYCATHPDAAILYRASDMILMGDSDGAYLVAPQARSRAGGYHYCGNKDGKLWNAPVLVIAKILRNVMSSAAETEIGSLFKNAQELLPL